MTAGRARAIGLVILAGLFGLLALAGWIGSLSHEPPTRMGHQLDGGFLVSSGQRVEGGSIAFPGRPIDLAVHPRDEVFAVLNKAIVFLADASGVRPKTTMPLGYAAAAGFRGLIWSHDGTRL